MNLQERIKWVFTRIDFVGRKPVAKESFTDSLKNQNTKWFSFCWSLSMLHLSFMDSLKNWNTRWGGLLFSFCWGLSMLRLLLEKHHSIAKVSVILAAILLIFVIVFINLYTRLKRNKAQKDALFIQNWSKIRMRGKSYYMYICGALRDGLASAFLLYSLISLNNNSDTLPDYFFLSFGCCLILSPLCFAFLNSKLWNRYEEKYSGLTTVNPLT